MPSAFLKVVSGTRQGLSVPLSAAEPLKIGRLRGDLLLDDAEVSSTHAQLLLREEGWVIQDLGSTNGTLVDGRPVVEAVLQPGAEIAIGGTRLVLFVGLADAQPDPNRFGGVARDPLEIAWLLDEELVDGAASDHAPSDVVDQQLHLPPGLHASFEVVTGEDAGKVFRFTSGNVTVGRKFGEVPLTDVEVSRRHAVIEVFGREMIFLRDLGSTNGTYHNGRRVAVSQLRSGDTVGIGRSVLRLTVTP